MTGDRDIVKMRYWKDMGEEGKRGEKVKGQLG